MGYWDNNLVDFSELVGKTLTEITNTDELIIFIDAEGVEYKMYHEQDCCENVYIDDINGNLSDLLNTPILEASARSESKETSKWGDSSTWTFYHIATIKGYVTIKWIGSSNGYYSESVSFCKLK